MTTLTVKRVWRDTQGSPLASAVSIGATSAVVEEVVDFDENGGEFVIGVDSGTYTGIDEDTETVLGLDPPLTVAHPKGTFLQDGAKARGPKYADGYVDDETSVTESVFIPSHLRRLFPLGGREPEDMEVVPVALDDDGSLYIVDGPPDEELAVDPVVFTWSLNGNVSTGTRVHRFPVPFGGTIEEVKMVMGTGGAPTGSSIIVDILKGGVSILGTKVVIAAGELGSDPIEPTTKEVSKGNILQVEFEQVGSTTPGSNPTLYLTMFPSENAIARRIEVAGPAGAAGANGADGADGLISEVRDEGVAVTDAGVMDFTGAGVTATSDGSVITVDIPGGGGGGGGDAKYKTAQTDRTSTTVLADDPHLAGWSLDASSVYRGTFELYLRTGSSQSVKVNFDKPSDIAFIRAGVVIPVGHTGTVITSAAASAANPDLVWGVPSAADCLFIVEVIVETTSAGTFDLQWAQNASSGNAISLRSYSSGSLVKVV